MALLLLEAGKILRGRFQGQIEFLGAFLDNLFVDITPALDTGRHQGVVADDVETPGHTHGVLVDAPHRSGGKDLFCTAGHFQAMIDVGLAFLGGERCEIDLDGESLAQGAVLRLHEGIVEFPLPDEKDIDQLGVGLLDIGEQAKFLEHLLTEALAVVDEQQDFFPFVTGFVQEMAELQEKFHL